MQFDSPYEQYREHNGKTCVVLRKLLDAERHSEVGDLFRIRLSTGEEIDAWPEELHENNEKKQQEGTN